MKIIFNITCLLLFAINALCLEIPVKKYSNKTVLSQEKSYLSMPWDVSILEDGGILLSDLKEQSIFFFRKDGSPVAVYKKNGQGPGEFINAGFNDYESPYFGLFDGRQIKLLLFKRESKDEIKWVRDLRGVDPLTWGINIYRNRIYHNGSHYINGRRYCIYSTGMDGMEEKHYLPAEVRFGLKENDDWKKIEPKYSRAWGIPRSYIYVYDEWIYSNWIGSAEIVKIRISDGTWTRIERNSKTYKQPDISEKAITSGRSITERLTDYSWTTGIFADKGMVGQLINTYDNRNAKWNLVLQTYNESVDSIKEEILEGISPPERSLCYYYSRTEGCLYIVNEETDGEDVKFILYQYKIRI